MQCGPALARYFRVRPRRVFSAEFAAVLSDNVPAGEAGQGIVFTANSRDLLAQFNVEKQIAVFAIEEGKPRDTRERLNFSGGPVSIRSQPRKGPAHSRKGHAPQTLRCLVDLLFNPRIQQEQTEITETCSHRIGGLMRSGHRYFRFALNGGGSAGINASVRRGGLICHGFGCWRRSNLQFSFDPTPSQISEIPSLFAA